MTNLQQDVDKCVEAMQLQKGQRVMEDDVCKAMEQCGLDYSRNSVLSSAFPKQQYEMISEFYALMKETIKRKFPHYKSITDFHPAVGWILEI